VLDLLHFFDTLFLDFSQAVQAEHQTKRNTLTNMTKIITAALALLTLGMIQLGIAEDAKTTTYEVTMTGVT
jgi:hypothetical protein